MSNKILNLDLSKDPIMPAIVYGRVGDDRLQTVTVNLTRRDEVADLTGYDITFEGTTYNRQTKVFDSNNISSTPEGLKKGMFDYTFPNMAFAVAGKYEQAYFSIVKDGKRDSTTGFEIYVDGNADIDAPEAETIITEYNKLVAELNELQNQAIDEMNRNFTEAQGRISELEVQINDLRNKIDQALTDFENGNFWTKEESFNKEESSANVIDQIGGAESTILKKELLVNGTEGMASRFVKDLPYTNIILNGDFKNGITNWSYHQPAGNLSEFVDDVVHAKSNNGTVTGVFQPSDQRLKYGYSTKANEKFFFYALAKGTGIIQLGFDKKRGSATLTQNYTWVGVESTGTTDNEVMTFYTTGEMWIKAIIVSKSEIMNIESFYPAAEDVGVVHGQPNLRNGTSSTLSEVTFIQTQYKETNLVVSNLFKPNDLVTYAVQIDNTAGTADVFAQLACKKSDNTYVSFNGSSVLKGSIGRSMVQVTVLEEYTNIYVKPLVKSNSTISTTVRYGEEKLINGSLEAMDEWTPSQADSGLTPINGGMVPFNEKDYEDLLSDDGIVRAETKIVGRGAEIETPFKIIEVFANRYPDIFGKTTTDAEKITCFKSIQKGVTIKSTLRGSGANASKNGQLYLKYTDGTSEFLVNNQTSEFVEISKTLTATQLDQLSSTGVLTVYATTKRNGTNDAGAISDGVTSALLEVKDLRLIVEIEANGKTIIESIIAAYHGENIATQEEAELGEENTKTMTPLRTDQYFKAHLATQEEAENGVSHLKTMTPKRTAEQTLARFGQSFTPSTKFIAHRGNNYFYPENSIAAFEKTSRHWGAETDIQLTTDGKWYCFHDRTLDRMTNGTGNFMDKTSSEIEALRLDTGNGINTLSDVEKKIPTFEQYLNACIKARIVPVIEITPLKTDFTDAQLDSIVTVIRRKGLLNKCVIICFTYEVLVKMRQRMPYTVMHWLISEYSEEMIQKCVINNFVPSFDYSKASVNQALIDKIHDAGLECGLWTVPYSDHQKYTDMGVDNITTDSASGNLRYFEPALRSGMLPNSVDLSGPTYIEETSNGEIHIRVNVTGGQNDVGVYICALESWAIPRHSLTLIGYVRSTKVTGFTFVPVSVGVGGYSANDSSIADANIKFGYLTTGTNWEQRATYAAFDLFYRI